MDFHGFSTSPVCLQKVFFWVDWDTKSRKSSNRLAIAIFQVGFHAQVWISGLLAMLVYWSSTSNVVNQRINNTRFQHLKSGIVNVKYIYVKYTI